MAFTRAFPLGYLHLLPIRSSKVMEQMRPISYYSKAFIDGEWVSAKSNKTFNVKNPFNGEVLTSVPDMDVVDVQSAIDAAKCSFEKWKMSTGKERSILLRKWYELLVKNQEELASIITAEAGKPLQESLGEVVYGNSFVDWFSEEARRTHGEVLTSPTPNKEMLLIKQPIGVTGLITPWNFPIAMITRKAGAALAAGCTCVIKPAEDTPLTALAVAALAHEAGIPKGVINVVTCDRANTPSVGKLLCESPDVAGISFTGSTEVGKILYKQCASGIKRVGLELGGNAPFIVFDSADVDKAVSGAIASKFRNAGQTCVSANRFFVQSKIFDDFVDKLKQKMQKDFVLGNGADKKVNLGPLINVSQLKKVNSIVEDAVKKGATIHVGGKPATTIGETFFEPTLLTNISPDMLCYVEEIFGPVVILMKFDTEREAVKMANDTQRGLAGYFYSNDIAQIWRVAKQLEVGMVGINEGIISAAEAAFGGIKESGIGREGSHHGLDDFMYIKYMCFGNL